MPTSKGCFTCRINGSRMCDGTCYLCGELCPGVGNACPKHRCNGTTKRYGRTLEDYILVCDTCGASYTT